MPTRKSVRPLRRLGPDTIKHCIAFACLLLALLGAAAPAQAQTATFVKTDSATVGNWKGVYGADGFNVIGDTSAGNPAYPAYAAVTPAGNSSFTWSGTTTDARALQKAAPGTTDRLAACWYSTSSFSVDLALTGGAHQVAVYVVDWDSNARGQTMQVSVAGSGTVLDSRSVSLFNGGQWLVWTMQGHVTLTLTKTGGANCVLCGLFFGGAQAPPAPTALAAAAGSGQASLSWAGSDQASGFNVKRSTTSGGPYATVAAGVHATTYADTGLTNGTPYYYVVSAVNAAGESANSAQAAATPSLPTLQIDCGSSVAYTSAVTGVWQADTDYTGGTAYTFSGTSVSGTSDPALLRSVRYDLSGFSYSLPAPAGSYVLTLSFEEGDKTAAGQRVFSVSVNGSPALTNFDVFAAAGGQNAAVSRAFPVTVTGGGGVTVGFTASVSSAMVSAILLAPSASPPAAPTGLSAAAGNARVALSWAAPGGSGLTYSVYRGTASGGEGATPVASGLSATAYTDTGLTNGQAYYYTVKASNAGGTGAASGEAHATPAAPALTSITVSPAGPSVYENGTQALAATGYDQYGNALATQPSFSWAVSSPASGGGSVGPAAGGSTTYTAPGSGTGSPLSVTVTATSGGVSGAAQVTVTNAAPTIAAAASASPNPVTGTTAALSVLGADDGGEGNLTYTWSVTARPSGAAAPTFSASGTNAAKNCTATFSQAGSYTLLATVTDAGGLTATSGVSVTVSQTLTAVTVSPSAPTVQPQGTQQFSASGTDQFGTALATQPTFAWSVTTSGGGSISSTGLYTAPQAAGSYAVQAAGGGVTGTATATVPQVLTAITVTPANPTVPSGGTQQFAAVATDQSGTALSPQPSFTWAATGGAVTSGGLYTAGSAPGSFAVTAASGAVSGSAAVSIPAVLTSITVSPSPAQLVTGGSQAFTATGQDQAGNALSSQPAFAWSVASGVGSIAGGTGAYSAGSTPGAATVQAASGAVTGSASVTVTQAPPAAPTNLAATTGNGQVTLTWTAPSGPVTGYTVQYGTQSGIYTTSIPSVSGSPYTVTGLTNGQAYYFVVSAVNAGGTGPASNEAPATPVAPPAAPANLTATSSNGQVTLAWAGVTGATSYNIYRATTSGGTYTMVSTAGADTDTNYTDNNPVSGDTYYYVVTAVGPGGESAYSNEAYATVTAPPTVPTSLTATAGNGQVTLSWTAPVGPVTSYTVQYTTQNGPYTTNILSISGSPYVVTGLTNGTTYYFVVSAVNVGGTGPDSDEANATPVAPLPATPANLVATVGNGQVTLTWTAAAGATSYNVKRATTSGGPYAVIGSPAGTSFTDTTAADGTTYYYAVSAVNSGGEGANSGAASAMPVDPTVAPPAAPLSLTATPGDGKVLLSWTAPAGTVTGYTVQYGTQSGTYTVSLPNIAGTACIVTGLADGTTYYFAVQAVNAGGPGQSSGEASATPAAGGPQWIVTDLSGKPIPLNTYDTPNDYNMIGTMAGSADYAGYPQDMVQAGQQNMVQAGQGDYVPTYFWNDAFSPFPNLQYTIEYGPYSFTTPASPLYPPNQGTTFPADDSGTIVEATGWANSAVNSYAYANEWINSFTSGPESVPEPLRGSVQSQVSGTLGAVWWWMGAGGAPDHIDVLVNTTVQAYAEQRAAAGLAQVPPGMSGSASITDSLREQASVDSSVTPPDTSSTRYTANVYVQNAGGKHLLRVPLTNGAATVSLGAQAAMSASNSGVDSQLGGAEGLPTAFATGSISATAIKDTRDLSVSCPPIDSPNSFYKGAYDPNQGTDRYIHLITPGASSATVDSVVSHVNDPVTGSHWIASNTLIANAVNFTQPTYQWVLSGAGNPGPDTVSVMNPTLSNPYGVSNLPAYLDFGATWNAPGTLPAAKVTAITVNVTDTDQSAATYTYTVNWHLPVEWNPGYQYNRPAPNRMYPGLAQNENKSTTIHPGDTAYMSTPIEEDVAGDEVKAVSIFLGAGSPAVAFLPEEFATGPAGIATMCLLAAGSVVTGFLVPPDLPPNSKVADYNEYVHDADLQAEINAQPGSGMPRFESGTYKLARAEINRLKALYGNTDYLNHWNEDKYFNQQGGTLQASVQVGRYREKDFYQGDGYDQHGYTGVTDATITRDRDPFWVFYWTWSSLAGSSP